MKTKLLFLLLLLGCFQGLMAQNFMRVNITLYDSLGDPYIENVPFSITNSDSTSFPGGLKQTYPYQYSSTLVDSLVIDSAYTGNLITINYFVCGQWFKLDTIFSGWSNQYTVRTPCIQACRPGSFIQRNFNGSVSFYSSHNSANIRHHWDFGDSYSDSGNSVHHTYTASGTYYVIHKVTHLISGCTYSDTTQLNISIGCGSNFSYLVSSSGFSVDFNSMAPDSNYYTFWDFGDGKQGFGRTPSNTYATSGYYDVTLILYSYNLWCIDTVKKRIFIPGTCKANFSHIIIGGNNVHFTNTTAMTFSSRFFWDFGDGDTLSTPPQGNVEHTYADTGTYMVKLVSNDGSGCIDTFTKAVVISANCKANLALGSIGVFNRRFYNMSSGIAKSTFWDFGDGDTATNDSNIVDHMYSDTGTFHLRLILTTKYCKDTFYYDVHIQENCDASFSAIAYSDRTAGIYSSYNTQDQLFLYDFGDGTTKYTDSLYFQHTYADTGTYYIKKVAVGLYCRDTVVQVVKIKDPCNAFFVPQVTAAKLYMSHVYDFPGSTNYWEFGDGDTSTQKEPVHVYAATGTYQVIRRTNYLTCQDVDTVSVTVTKLCGATVDIYMSGHMIRFYNFMSHPQADSVSIDLGDGTKLDSVPDYHYYNYSGQYPVRLITYSSGCTDTIDYLAKVLGNCSANFTYYQSGGTMYFSASGSSGGSFQWSFGDGNTSGTYAPWHIYNSSGTYKVQLVVSDFSNCYDTMIKYVYFLAPCNALFDVEGTGTPYTYKFTPQQDSLQNLRWIINDTDTSTAKPMTRAFSGGKQHTIRLEVLDSNGNVECSFSYWLSSNSCGTLSNNNQVSGVVLFNHVYKTDYDSLRVYLIEYDSIAGTLTGIDSIILYNIDSARYIFSICDSVHTYLIKVACLPGSKYYSNYLPTYADSSTVWSGARRYDPNNSWSWSYVYMIQGANPGGPGFIGGYISMGANKSGGMLEGVQVNIYTDAGNPVGYTYTNAGGRYEFPNLAVGKYKVLVEIPGKPTDIHYVTLTDSRLSVDELNFEVNKEYISALNSLRKLLPDEYKLYPVPAGNTLNLELAGQQETHWEITIMDVHGRALVIPVSANGSNSFKIDTENLPQGIYILKLVSANTVTNLQFIKQ